MITFVSYLGRDFDKPGRRYYGLFRCSFCKKIVKIRLDSPAKSCGCKRIALQVKANTTHGDSDSGGPKRARLYRIWLCMRQRCNNPHNTHYQYYGGKGISICEDWEQYIVFKNWALKNGYKENLTIDRLKDNENYCPENCQWLTSAENTRCRESNKLDWDKVKVIRWLCRTMKYSQKEIGDMFKVRANHISAIQRNARWSIK